MSKKNQDNRRRRIVILQITVIVAVVIIAVILLLMFFLTGGKYQAKKTAKTYMEGISAQDINKVLKVTDEDNEICVAFANAFARDDETISGFEYEISDCSKATDEDISEAANIYYSDAEKEFDKAYICKVNCTIEAVGSNETTTTVYEIFSYKLNNEWYALRLR